MPEIAISGQIPKFWLLALASFLAVSCTGLSEYDTQQVETALNDSLITTTESWDVEISLMRQGKIRMIIDGSYAIQYQSEENQHTAIDGPVYVQLFDTLGNLETEAWSRRAIFLEEEREFELIDSVRVQTVDDHFLYSEYLKYAQESDRISSPQFVIIVTPTDSISGRGFDGSTDLNLSDYTLSEPRGRFTVD